MLDARAPRPRMRLLTVDIGLIEVRDLSKSFRGLHALERYGVTLEQQEIPGIIGPNGAGKSTVFNLLSGHIRPSGGAILFDRQDITRESPDQIAKRGIGRTFQNIGLFPSMMLLENVTCAEELHVPARSVSSVLGLPGFHTRELRRAALESLALTETAIWHGALISLRPPANTNAADTSIARRATADRNTRFILLANCWNDTVGILGGKETGQTNGRHCVFLIVK